MLAIDLRSRARLVSKSRKQRRIPLHEVPQDELHRHPRVEGEVVRDPHATHAPVPQRFHEPQIRADELPRLELRHDPLVYHGDGGGGGRGIQSMTV
jgi:hypothetical protein